MILAAISLLTECSIQEITMLLHFSQRQSNEELATCLVHFPVTNDILFLAVKGTSQDLFH